MSSKNSIVLPAVIATLVLVGCSSDSDDSGGSTDSGNTSTDGTSTEGSTTDGTSTETTTEGTTTEGTDAGFFNDERGIVFANDLGSDISRIISSAFSAVPLFLGSAQGDASPRLARATQSGSDACISSGSVDYSFVTDDATGQPVSASVNYNNCNDGDIATTGGFSVTFSGSFDDDNGSFDLLFNDFSVSAGDEVSMINGDLGMSVSTVGDTVTGIIQGNSIEMISTGGIEESNVTFSAFQMTTITNDTTGDTSVGGQSDIATPEGSLNVSINPELRVTGDADYPSSGVVTMSASDGSSLQIDADSGDPATYSYIITDRGGSVSSGVANWADADIDLDVDL